MKSYWHISLLQLGRQCIETSQILFLALIVVNGFYIYLLVAGHKNALRSCNTLSEYRDSIFLPVVMPSIIFSIL